MTIEEMNRLEGGSLSKISRFHSDYSVVNTNENNTSNQRHPTATTQSSREIITQILSSKLCVALSTVVVTVFLMVNIQSFRGQNVYSSAISLRRNESISPPVMFSSQNESLSHSVTRDFAEYFASLPWKALEYSISLGPSNINVTDHYISDIVHGLSEYAGLEPRVSINESCTVPPPLLVVENINCSAYPKAFTGIKRDRPARVGILIPLGFEIDVLEVHLRELYDVIDYFFIMESTKAHFHMMEKPLMWEKVRNQPRFKIFADKIVHMIVDDVEATTDNNANGNIWTLENFQSRRRWEKFAEWNAKTKYFSDDDILGFGDADEVASRANVQLLKNCQFTGPVDIGIWMPFGLLDHAFHTYAPVPDHVFTLGDPTFWTVGNATATYAAGRIPNRQTGTSGKYLIGGMHMTDHRYLPFMLIKKMTCTECGISTDWLQTFRDMETNSTSRDVYNMEMVYGDRVYTSNFEKGLIALLKDFQPHGMDEIVVIPWFLGCNLKRYPYWEKGHDTRLDPY